MSKYKQKVSIEHHSVPFFRKTEKIPAKSPSEAVTTVTKTYRLTLPWNQLIWFVIGLILGSMLFTETITNTVTITKTVTKDANSP